jgi:hypothetical protein
MDKSIWIDLLSNVRAWLDCKSNKKIGLLLVTYGAT